MIAFDGNPLPPIDPGKERISVRFTGAVPDDEIQRIRAIGDALDRVPVGIGGQHNPEHVDLSGSRLRLSDETRWIYDRMEGVLERANVWGFDLRGFEPFCYLCYDRPGQHFGWHADSGPSAPFHRKLSIIVQLSAPSEYEGGDVEVLVSCAGSQQGHRDKGAVLAFPSFRQHRVLPVTKGVRRSLLAFAVGPSLR